MLRTEASIEGTCRDKAALAGCVLLKLHHGIVGMPDQLLIRDNGTVVFAEFKRPKGQPEKIQAYWHGILRDMGHQVEVVRSVEQFKGLLTTATENGSISLPDGPAQENPA